MKKFAIRVTWLSPIKYPVGFQFVNVFGRVIGEVVSSEPMGCKYHRTEANLSEDLPMEVVLKSRLPMKEVKNE